MWELHPCVYLLLVVSNAYSLSGCHGRATPVQLRSNSGPPRLGVANSGVGSGLGYDVMGRDLGSGTLPCGRRVLRLRTFGLWVFHGTLSSLPFTMTSSLRSYHMGTFSPELLLP